MRFVYFTERIFDLQIPQVIEFMKEAGLDGVDLAVRPRHPVNPENVETELPKAVATFQAAGLVVGFVTAHNSVNDPESAVARRLFDSCGKAGVTAIKVGYFRYAGGFEASLADARKRLTGFARLAEKTGVRACYHTHSGGFLGANGSALRLLLQDFDPHHIGAYLDTGHLAIGGGPFPMEVDMVRRWFSLLSIKDMVWEKVKGRWDRKIVPVGEGIVRWAEVARGLKDVGFDGTISLHGEYEVRDLEQRRKLAKQELASLKKWFVGKDGK